MSTERYGQYCPLAHALDLIGERWCILVIRELLPGPLSYPSLLERLPGIGPALLTHRLNSLEARGLIERDVQEPRTASEPYLLTERGRRLETVLLALTDWGRESLDEPGDDLYSPYWSLLPLCASYRPERAPGLNAEFEFKVGADHFHVRATESGLEPRYGPAAKPAYVLHIDAEAFLDLTSGRLDIKEAVRAKTLRVEGSLRAFAESLTYFDIDRPANA